MGIVRQITDPAGAVLTHADARAWGGIDATGDSPTDAAVDANLDGLIAGFTAVAETELGRPLLTRDYQLALDRWPSGTTQLGDTARLLPPPCSISLVLGGVTAIKSIKYQDPAGSGASPLTVDTSVYFLNLEDEPPTVELMPTKSWPQVLAMRNTIVVTFTAGWANAGLVPQQIKHWILMHDKAVVANPFLDHLLNPSRVHSFA